MKTNAIVTCAFFLLTSGMAAAEGGAGGKAGTGASAPAAAAPSASAPADAKKPGWDKMTFAQKRKYMKSTVLPEMKKLFVAYDAKTYQSMTCQTCHGDKAVEGKFKMPNAQLPKLPQPTNQPGFMALGQKKPDAMKFMGTQVKPKMAALLGIAEWTPTNPTGYGCYGCHTQEGAPGAAPTDSAPKTAAPKADGPKAGAPAKTAPAAKESAKAAQGW